MGKWSNVGGAKASGDSLPNLFPDHPVGTRAELLVRIAHVKDVDGRSGDVFFIIEFEVLKSTHEDCIVGRQYSQVIKYNHEMGPPNVKRFILAASGLDPNDEENDSKVGEEETEFVLSEDQPFANQEMNVTVEVILTKAKKKPFTKLTWHAIDTEDSASVDPKDVH